MKLAFILLLLASNVFAQGFDPQCWKPRIGIEIDTILRENPPGYFFGDQLMKHPNWDPDDQHIMITGHPSNPANHTVLGSGKYFDLHKLEVRKKMNMSLFSSGNGQPAIFGNFRTTKYKDAFIASEMKIYWADDNGDFDSSRYTQLRSSVQGNRPGQGFRFDHMNWYCAKLISDSLDDLLTMGITNYKTLQENDDSARVYIVLFAGQNLYHPIGEVALSDSVYLCGQHFDDTVERIPFSRIGNDGDFRGIGRKDWIAAGPFGNMFYFRNDFPFTMEKFFVGMRYDTILTQWENPHLQTSQSYYLNSRRSLRAFWKPSWDRSEDFVGRFNTDDERKEAWLFFRGGSDFGSKRLYLDSAELVIRHPFGAGFNFGFGFEDCGDMTGTGNTVIRFGGGYGQDAGESMYFVLGKAADDLIDIHISYSVSGGTKGAGYSAHVLADNDDLQDRVIDLLNYRGDSLMSWAGSLGLMHGSTRIPVRLNPKYSVEEQRRLRTTQMYAHPNPCESTTTLTFENCTRGVLTMDVYDRLGNRLIRDEVPDVDNGIQQYSANLASLASGFYYIRLSCPLDGWQATTSVIKSAPSTPTVR
jgi:hypothetical protein